MNILSEYQCYWSVNYIRLEIVYDLYFILGRWNIL